jgi:hypothetical protein
MNDKNTRRTLLPKLAPGAAGSIMSGLLALIAVALIALGVGLIYFPAGIITAGLGAAVLQWQFFGGQA